MRLLILVELIWALLFITNPKLFYFGMQLMIIQEIEKQQAYNYSIHYNLQNQL